MIEFHYQNETMQSTGRKIVSKGAEPLAVRPYIRAHDPARDLHARRMMTDVLYVVKVTIDPPCMRMKISHWRLRGDERLRTDAELDRDM